MQESRKLQLEREKATHRHHTEINQMLELFDNYFKTVIKKMFQ